MCDQDNVSSDANLFLTDEEIRNIINGYEVKYGLPSSEFLSKYRTYDGGNWELLDWKWLLEWNEPR